MKKTFLIFTVLSIGMLACFASSLLLVSCEGNAVYKKFDENFPASRWDKTDVRTYDFKIEKAGKYDVQIDFSHVYGIQFNDLPVRITMSKPDKTMLTRQFLLTLRDEQGTELGDCAGDYCDVRQTVVENESLEPGKYSIMLANGFDFEYFPNVLGLGVRVVTSKD
jgi:gliding motility-associated lipoprotein GldH